MVETVSIKDAIYDLETIRIAAETYEQVDHGPFDGAFESLNAWHDDNSLTAETIGTYLDRLRDTVAELDSDGLEAHVVDYTGMANSPRSIRGSLFIRSTALGFDSPVNCTSVSIPSMSSTAS